MAFSNETKEVVQSLDCKGNRIVNVGLQEIDFSAGVPVGVCSNQIVADTSTGFVKQWTKRAGDSEYKWYDLGGENTVKYLGVFNSTSPLPNSVSQVSIGNMYKANEVHSATYKIADKKGDVPVEKTITFNIDDMMICLSASETDGVVWSYIPSGQGAKTIEVTVLENVTNYVFTNPFTKSVNDLIYSIINMQTGEKVIGTLKDENDNWTVIQLVLSGCKTGDKYAVKLFSI